MFQKKVAILAAVILTAILLSPVFAQETHPAKVDTSGQNAGMTFEPAPTPEAATPQTPVQPSAVSSTRDGRDGKDGKDGRNGRNGRDGKTIVREGRQGHGKMLFNTLRGKNIPGQAGYGQNGYNVVSESNVDAKVTKKSREDRAYTDGVFKGANLARTSSETTEKDHNKKGLPWWLIPLLVLFGLLALLLLLGALFGASWNRFWAWLSGLFSRARCEPAPADITDITDITNKLGATIYGRVQPDATIVTLEDGTAVEVYKCVMTGPLGSPWVKAKAGEEIKIKMPVGRKRFKLQAVNKTHLPANAKAVWLHDELASAMKDRQEMVLAELYIGKTKVRDLTEAEKERLLAGQDFCLGDFVTEVPVGVAIDIIYDVEPLTGRDAPGTAEEAGTDVGADSTYESVPPVNVAEFLKAKAKAKQEAEEAARKAEADRKAAEAKAVAEQATKKAAEKPAETVKPETRAETEKPKTETKAEIVDRVRKEVTGRDNPVPSDFQTYLLGLENETAVRTKMSDYYHARGKLIHASKTQSPDARPNYNKVNDLSAKVAMGTMTVEEAEKELTPSATETPATEAGNAEQAKTGLLTGMAGGA